MVIDKDLFLYDLAVVSIMKNEGLYIKEWLDYHLLAGVDHFYIYDNAGTDNMKEIMQPYIDKKIITYIYYPGAARQYEAFNDAVQRYRFFCRYMAFIDADEFIFPQNNRSIVEVVDEVLSRRGDAAALVANWHMFGSNYHDTADYSVGVLERFTRRVEKCDLQVKTIANPRKINFFCNPHFAFYYKGFFAFNEDVNIINGPYNEARTDSKICINHYHLKSREEYQIKVNRGNADAYNNTYKMKNFSHEHSNDVLDDSIVKYRDFRKQQLAVTGDVLESLASRKTINYNRISDAVIKHLAPMFAKNLSPNFFNERLGLYLTCWKLCNTFQQDLFNETAGNIFTEAALKAINHSVNAVIHVADIMIMFAELPNILTLKSPAAKDIRKSLCNVIPSLQNMFRTFDVMDWKEFVDLSYTLKMLQSFDACEKNHLEGD